jgi:hypothetical protein
MRQEFESLLTKLSQLVDGKITGSGDRSEVIALLTLSWPYIEGGSAESTWPDKLSRLEDLQWTAPVISFVLERHGGTVFGSSRAELHEWNVDTSTWKADVTTSRYRQLTERNKPLNTRALADEIALLIFNGFDSEFLEWNQEKTSCRIFTSKIVPDNASKQTITGRRKRFRVDLQSALQSHGWSLNVRGSRVLAVHVSVTDS